VSAAQFWYRQGAAKLADRCLPLEQGWANFFVGGPNEKSKMSGGPTYFLLAILVNNNKPQTRGARIAKQ
jgi:hypothetical protein